MIKKGISKTT